MVDDTHFLKQTLEQALNASSSASIPDGAAAFVSPQYKEFIVSDFGAFTMKTWSIPGGISNQHKQACTQLEREMFSHFGGADGIVPKGLERPISVSFIKNATLTCLAENANSSQKSETCSQAVLFQAVVQFRGSTRLFCEEMMASSGKVSIALKPEALDAMPQEVISVYSGRRLEVKLSTVRCIISSVDCTAKMLVAGVKCLFKRGRCARELLDAGIACTGAVDDCTPDENSMESYKTKKELENEVCTESVVIKKTCTRDADDICSQITPTKTTCAPIETLNDAADCFPSSASVTKADGTTTLISNLGEGDAILATDTDGKVTTDSVSILSINVLNIAATFVKLQTDRNATLELTSEHHLPVGGACCSTLKKAKDIEVGQTVWVYVPPIGIGPERVVAKSLFKGVGLHSPVLTNGGLPIVNDVVTAFDSIEIVRFASYVLPLALRSCSFMGICPLFRRGFITTCRLRGTCHSTKAGSDQ